MKYNGDNHFRETEMSQNTDTLCNIQYIKQQPEGLRETEHY